MHTLDDYSRSEAPRSFAFVRSSTHGVNKGLLICKPRRTVVQVVRARQGNAGTRVGATTAAQRSTLPLKEFIDTDAGKRPRTYADKGGGGKGERERGEFVTITAIHD